MKKFYLCLLAIFAITFYASGQENKKKAKDKAAHTTEQTDLDQAIWKKRSKYFNISILSQTFTDNEADEKYKGYVGPSISWGKTYYLHKKPIASMMKFGLDWTWLDMGSGGKKLDNDVFDTDETEANMNIYIGMQFGPSITINPVQHLKVSAYFRASPSYSILILDETSYNSALIYYNAGCSVAWKVISLGVEWRKGSYAYNYLNGPDDYGTYPYDPNRDTPKSKRQIETNALRFYVGFRF